MKLCLSHSLLWEYEHYELKSYAPLLFTPELKKKRQGKILTQLNINKILHLMFIPGSQRYKELCGALGSCCVVTQNPNIKPGALSGLL